MLRVIAIVAANEYESTELGVNEFPVTPLASLDPNKSCVFKIADQLPYFARHTIEIITRRPFPPVRIQNLSYRVVGSQARISSTTRPKTSVRRKRRPWYLKVRRS